FARPLSCGSRRNLPRLAGEIGLKVRFCRRALGVCAENRYNRKVAGRTDSMCGSGATTGKKMGVPPIFFC
ncbi:hypothetical protein, partial [Burkholderia ubonensis]|uniref:hypothetical protein n=2 Tax=Burkholderia ubonensis TaxID=101571 RepID=UPI001C436157